MVPFCVDCDRFYNPNTLSESGDCPSGHHVADPAAEEPVPPLPWHFKVMLGMLLVYLGWRFVQLVGAIL